MALQPEHSLTITKEEVKLPEAARGKLAFLLHNVVTNEECERLIAESEEKGFETLLSNGRQVANADIGNSFRCIIDSNDYADTLWQRVKAFIPEVFSSREVVGLNERLRFLRYDKGQYFKPHMDGCNVRENGEKSYLTVQLYLNEEFKGGATTFLGRENEAFSVYPKKGTMLIFQHNICHEASLQEEGTKYTIRTDVMYLPLKQ